MYLIKRLTSFRVIPRKNLAPRPEVCGYGHRLSVGERYSSRLPFDSGDTLMSRRHIAFSGFTCIPLPIAVPLWPCANSFSLDGEVIAAFYSLFTPTP